MIKKSCLEVVFFKNNFIIVNIQAIEMTKSVLDSNPNPDIANEYSSCCNMLSSQIVSDGFRLPCNPDHNGECLVCDCWLSDCQFIKKDS